MAEAIGRKWFSQKLKVAPEALEEAGYEIRSGGLSSDFEPHGSCPSEHGVTVMASLLGLDISNHRSRVLTAEQLQSAYRVYCVSRSHVNNAKAHFGVPAERLTTLGADIPDPWHGPIEDYAKTAEAMAMVVPAALERDWEQGIFADM
jgi:protein-tyrosine-phosphatase